MREIIKYSVSAILLILSAVLLINHNFGKPEPSSIQGIDSRYSTNVNIEHYNLEYIFRETGKASFRKIHPVIILTTEACYLCLNNVAEFSDLLKNDSSFAELILLFVDEDDTEIDKFIRLTELDIPFATISKIDDHIINEKQNLIFIDKPKKQIFYNYPIPNAIMLPENKVQIINQAKSIWQSQIVNSFKSHP